ncbi:MAG: cupin domain-containing protein [Clostridia bacterium]|nr:cupin domain-containing protein [Clostridia bacterium]
MKTLITVSEIKQFAGSSKKTMYIDANTIVTPAARDAAGERGIKIVVGAPPEKISEKHQRNEAGVSTKITETVKQNVSGSVDPALIAKIVGEVIKSLNQSPKPPQLVKEADPSGLRLVKGNSVVLENFNTGDPSHNVKIKEILSIKESPNMATGFMSMENTTFDWHLTYDEIDYIVEGTLEFIVNGKKYTGTAGDVFFIPADTKVTFSAPDKVKFFFVTYPANWAELSGYEK